MIERTSKSLAATLGSIFLIAFLVCSFPNNSQAQKYSYRIIDYSEMTYMGGGIWLLVDHCYTGPGLCGSGGGIN